MDDFQRRTFNVTATFPAGRAPEVNAAAFRRRVSVLPVAIAALVLLAIPAFAWAADAPPADAGGVYEAIITGRWSWLVGFAIIALVEPVKRSLVTRWPHVFAVDVVGVALAFVVAAATNAGAALVAGEPWTTDLAVAILRSAFVAIGGYITLKRLVVERVPALGSLLTPLPKARVLKAPDITATSPAAGP